MEIANLDMMNPYGTLLFALAVLHTFSVKKFQELAHRFPKGGIRENLFHFLGEIEVVFGLWAGLLFLIMIFVLDLNSAKTYFDNQNYTEPLFVFAIMTVAATKPVLVLAERLVTLVSQSVPIGPRSLRRYCSILILGPLMGSFITEPAAMTVTAVLLRREFFDRGISTSFKYASLGLLFVNISIGGTLTHFAAPPVLMVAEPWGWNTAFMLENFGLKALLCVIMGTSMTAVVFRRELSQMPAPDERSSAGVPLWLSVAHLFALGFLVALGHYRALTLGFLLFFLGLAKVTEKYQEQLRLRESLLVGFFLAGLVVFGGFQRWWLEPLVASVGVGPMFFGAIGLTAVTDNAALTYLGTQVPSLSDSLKYALVSGAVIGGGLTVIANAPNPAGFQILSPSFSPGGISPLRLFLAALPYTAFAALIFGLRIASVI